MPAVRVQLVAPLDSEREQVEDLDERFAEQVALLSGGPHGLEAWLLQRVGERAGAGGGRVSWSELRATDAPLAEAGARWLNTRGHPLPDDARNEPAAHFPLTEADWGVLLGDYLLRGRVDEAASTDVGFQRAAAERALATIGLMLERGMVLPGPDPAVEILGRSATKPGALADALAAEDEARGPALRAVVLVDERRGPDVLAAVRADERLVDLAPRVAAGDDADAWRALAGGTTRLLVVAGRSPGSERAGAANVVCDLHPRGGRQTADMLLAEDGTRWEIVCADPTLRAGDADYRLLVEREGDPSALHPALTAQGPPPLERFAEVNLQQRDAATGGALGAPPVRGPSAYVEPRPELTPREKARILRQAFGVFGWLDPWSVRLGLVWVLLGIGLLITDHPVFGIPWVIVTPVWVIGIVLRSRTRRLRRRYPRELPLDWAVFAVCEAYAQLGELPDDAAERRRLAVERDGTLRIELPALTEEQRARVEAAVRPLVTPGAVPRIAVSRAIDDGHGRSWYPVPEDFAREPRRAMAFYAGWKRWAGPGWVVELDLDDEQARTIAGLAQRPGGADDGGLDLPDLPEAFGEQPLNLPPLPDRPAPATATR